MSSQPSSKSYVKWEKSNGAEDFLQLSIPSGDIVGWIDPEGMLSGSLAAADDFTVGVAADSLDPDYLFLAELTPLLVQVSVVNPPEYSGAIQGTAIANRTGTTDFSQVIGTSGMAGVYGHGSQSVWGVFGQANGLSSVTTEYILGVYGYAELDAVNGNIVAGGFFEAAAPARFTGAANVFAGTYVPAMEVDFNSKGDVYTGVPAIVAGHYSGTQATLGALTAAFYAADCTSGIHGAAGANDWAFYSAAGKSKFDTLIFSSHAPASASATGIVGQIAWDSGFLYMCVATNTWKRVAIATW